MILITLVLTRQLNILWGDLTDISARTKTQVSMVSKVCKPPNEKQLLESKATNRPSVHIIFMDAFSVKRKRVKLEGNELAVIAILIMCRRVC